MQDAFEQWISSAQGLPPLVIKPWYDIQVHWVERIKWLNTDKMREILAANPQIEPIIVAHLGEMQMALMPPAPQVGPDGKPLKQGANAPGGGQAMTGSNRESAAIDTLPSGNRSMPGPM
jgi:hypothetical protein